MNGEKAPGDTSVAGADAGGGSASGTDSGNGSTEGSSVGEKPVVEITMADGGKIDIQLDPDKAPKTVANFLKLVEDGFYDGLIFHRIIPGFMIQGGDPQGTGMGGSDESVAGEFANNGWTQNDISHVRGVISMARSNDPNSASSQFFITNADATFLDGDYAAFGTVISGMDVVDQISAVEISDPGVSDRPVDPPVIQSIKRIS
jgi:peptidyl-prolyl cis-trans isomerase B (cyclophilin B)